MVPLYVACMLVTPIYPKHQIYAIVIFALASLTDLLDGKIARKYNLVTNFGKFMDPLADKLLVCAALVCMTELKAIPAWITIVIISREFIISGFRLIAAEKGSVIAASMWGKVKTAVTMVMLIARMIVVDYNSDFVTPIPYNDVFVLITEILLYASLILTVVSLVDYLVKNKDVLKDAD